MKVTILRTPGRELADRLKASGVSVNLVEGAIVNVGTDKAKLLAQVGLAALDGDDEPPAKLEAIPESALKTSETDGEK